jgi:hypothetical protein
MLATAWEDGSVRIHVVPDVMEGHVSEAAQTLPAHAGKRAGFVLFHPYVAGVLVTADSVKEVKVWDVEASAETATLGAMPKPLVNASWSYDSVLLVTSSKDKHLRVYDPRAAAAAPVSVAPSVHKGAKGGRAVWLGRIDRIATVGFNANNVPELSLIDPRAFGTPVQNLNLGVAQGTMFPFYDEELGLLYVAAKGEGTVKVLEATASEVSLVAEHKSKDPQAAITLLPKQGFVNPTKCEVARFLKLVESKKLIAPLHFEVPRQAAATVFQEDLYPPVYDGTPVMSVQEWMAGAPGKMPTLTNFKH